MTEPSIYLLFVGLCLTAGAKMRVLFATDAVSDTWFGPVTVLALDVAVLAGVACAFIVAESRVPRLRWLTVPAAAVLLAVLVVNAATLSIAGEQITREAVALGLSRFDDVWSIVTERLAHEGAASLVVLVLVGSLFPIACRRWLDEPTTGGSSAAGLLAGVAVLAATAWTVFPEPRSPSLRRMSAHVTLELLAGGGTRIDGEATGVSTLGPDTDALRASPIDSTRGRRHSVMMIVLESARYDHTSLPDTETTSMANTPRILELARRGTWARNARAVVPHTTKSLYSILCGRVPMLQSALIETTEHVTTHCVPETLTEAGYRSAFFQSAIGAFEHRPRLVDNLGFEHFEAWEDIGGEALGYLASDDRSLAGAVSRWLDAVVDDGSPFFVTVLTSSTHHPYRLPRSLAAEPGASGLSEQQRFVRLLEIQDDLVGALVDDLERRGLDEDTIVIVAGDHGEGFGAKGVRQHDNNFYEEGLHVPLVFAGPGVPRLVLDANASLADVGPSVLDLLGRGAQSTDHDPRAGQSVFRVPNADRKVHFGCFYDGYCYGYVQGDRKVVLLPRESRLVYFDLRTDPNETDPRPWPDSPDATVAELKNFVLSARRTVAESRLAENLRYGQWRCPLNERCRHPRTPEDVFFESPF